MSINFRELQLSDNTTNTTFQKHKHLGLLLDHKLKWNLWTDLINTKTQQTMHFLKKLLLFNVCSKMLQMFYSASIEIALTFCIICWFGNATEAQKNGRKIVIVASKPPVIMLPSMENIQRDRLMKNANIIVGERKKSHLLLHLNCCQLGNDFALFYLPTKDPSFQLFHKPFSF